MGISPKCHIESGAEIGEDVEIGPFCYIGEKVKIGNGCRLIHSVTITGNTTLGEKNIVFPYAVLGSPPQDLKYKGEDTRLVLGEGNMVREFVTMNMGTAQGGGETRVGSHCLFMACSHVAHDCKVGNNVIMANNVLLAGHVRVEDRAILNGAAAINQYTTIGTLAFIGGLTRIVQDVPPYMIVEGNPSKVRGVNVVGLRRNGFSEEEISALKKAHREIFRKTLVRREILDEIEREETLSPAVRYLVHFLRAAEHGKQGRAQESPEARRDT